MKDHVKYARARDQLYNVKVAFRELKAKMPRHHRTAQLEQIVDILETVINQSCDAFENGNVLEVLINMYVPTPLPGFEEYVAKAREAAKMGLTMTEDELYAIEANTGALLDALNEAWEFVPEGGWEDYTGSVPDAYDDEEDIPADDDVIDVGEDQ